MPGPWRSPLGPWSGRALVLGLVLGLVLELVVGLACGGGGDNSRGDRAVAAVAPEAPVAPALPTAPVAPESRIEAADVWLDLLAQRPSAGWLRDDRLLIDLGLPQAQKYLELAASSPWGLGREVEGERAGVLYGLGGSLDLPVDGSFAVLLAAAPGAGVAEKPGEPPPSAPLALALTLKSLAEDQVMTVLWDEQVLANLTLGTNWQRRTLSLPPTTRAGEGRLRLHFRRLGEHDGEAAAVALRTVELGAREVIVGGPPAVTSPPYRVDSGDLMNTSMTLGSGSGLIYYVRPPRRSRIRVEARGRGALRISASTDDDHRRGRPPTAILQEALRPGGGRYEVDLSGYGGEPLRLEVAVESRDGGEATLQNLAIVSPRALPVDRRRRELRDLYILAVEGARADDLLGPVTGGPRYPAVERLLSEGLVFDRAYASGPWAITSHAVWLSSVRPAAHRTVKGTYVADRQVLFPEVLDRAGYATVVATADLDFSSERGLTQGVDALLSLTRGSSQRNDAIAVVRGALEAVAGRPSPRMMMAIVSDPQAPYEPAREYQGELTRPEGSPLPHLTHLWIGKVRAGKVEPTAAELAYVRRLYRGELQVVDQALGELLDQLTRERRLERSIVVLVGLHGEEFYEHGGAGHGFSLHEEVLRVPLAIRAPELLAPGRVTVPVDLLDLAPTLVDLLGLPFPVEWQGESLVPVIDDPQPPPRLILASMGDGSQAAIVGESKLILGSGRESQRLYDLRRDPGERTSRAAEGGIALRILRNAVSWELAADGRWKRARWGTGADLRPAFALDQGM